MLIIGSKPLKNINIDDILDSFEKNIRFNFNLPNNNNGTKQYIRIMNNHVYSNKDDKNIAEKYKHFNIDNDHLTKFQNTYKKIEDPNNIILANHSDKKKYNDFLKRNGCNYKINKLPRMGIHGIMRCLLNNNKNIFITHYSLNEEENKQHQYVNINNNKHSNIHHDIEDEFNIIIWLHNNNYIDATLSLLQNKVLPTIDCNIIKPRSNMLIKLLKKYGICILTDYFDLSTINKLEDEYDNIFNTKQNLIEKSEKEECSNDERIFYAENYSNTIKELFYDNNLFSECAKAYKSNLNKKTLINKVEFKEGIITNSGAGWHRDNHDCQFKALMYLTDVNENNGNFQFITNSSKKYIGYPKPRTQNYNTRFADETVNDLINKNQALKLHNIIGKKGTIVLVDTTYIHRGNIIREGLRKAITQYFF
jgi:hypothetical protein